MSDENVVFLCNDFLKFNGQHSGQDELMVGKVTLVVFLS